MSSTRARQRVETGIWKRTSADGRTRYEIAYRDSDDRQRRQVVEGGLKAARTALATVKADMGRGVRVAPATRLTFDAAADAWWAAHSHAVRPKTRSAYDQGLKHLRPEFGRRKLDTIGPADLGRYVATKRADGYRGWTIRGHLVVIRLIFTHAQRRLDFTGTNPATLLERGERPSTDDQRPKRILAPDELQRLLSAIPDRHRLLFELIAETGVRKGEALGLTWQDVGLDTATLTTTHQLQRSQRVRLKTDRSRRTIEITRTLAHQLRAHRLASPHSQPHDLVFAGPSGRGMDPRGVLRIIQRAADHAGLGELTDHTGRVILPTPDVHDLRHTHASALIAAGWDIEEVSARLGHADTSTTLRAYAHAYDAARRSDQRRDRLTTLYAQAAS